MTKEVINNLDYLFEVSWEVCNKVGGIYTVIASKSLFLQSQLKKHHIFIGPDVWMDTEANPDFVEDFNLYRSWKAEAAQEGLRIRIGRWQIPGEPIAILVDFKQFLSSKNDVLAKLWEGYGVDSLSGNWDYVESALFGYVSARLIESFYNFYLSSSDRVIAQFHEWQTGAGVLRLKSSNLPIATVFTTHATVIGRCLAGNNFPLYDSLESYNADEMAARFNVVAMHSLEKKSAQNATVFTTVSDITAKECKQFLGREVDIVTPNGFEDVFTPQSDNEYNKKFNEARQKLLQVASAMSQEDFPSDSLIIGIGGRYEYRNKGIDLFLDALSSIQNSAYSGKKILAFIMIPSGHSGPDKALQAKLNHNEGGYTTQLSHYLSYPDNDQITRRLTELSLLNDKSSNVRLYFVPSYLNGNDGIFDMPYYDMLIGLDLALFPSYYEPWGYTPLEALAFSVPTLTTTLAGFGLWVNDYYKDLHPGITVVERNDSNYLELKQALYDRIIEIANLDAEALNYYRKNAKEVSSIALWNTQIKYYKEAYTQALDKILEKRISFQKTSVNKTMKYDNIEINAPSWKSVMVTRRLPEELADLEKLSKNLWWCWNEDAKALFKSIDPEVWHSSSHNPLEVLDRVNLKKFNELAKDKDFLSRLADVMKDFNAYMALKSERTSPSVAYFCMEYGLDTSLKIYSGGLGILAGDYLKETSDMNVNLVAVGFLYRYGYFNQVLSSHGDQIANYDAQDFSRLPIEPVKDENGEWLTTTIAFPGRTLSARIWKVAVGRTDLYLLDTDYEANLAEDRQITYHLYGGDWENRLKQELLLGVGGIRALRSLGINPQVYHCNEGHAAFIGLERLREYVQNEKLSFNQAMEVVRASSLFTTHTPVPAGHDAFEEGLLRQYIGHYPERLQIDWETMMSLGKLNARDVNEKFSMSILATNISQNVNGVSMLHGKVSQEILANMYKGYLPEELHISYVTNGVHYSTWTAHDWKNVHDKVFGEEFKTHHYDKSCFSGIYNISDEEIWNVRKKLKNILVESVKERLSDTLLGNHYSPSEIVAIKENFNADTLTIGFARRFATYKRATLLFSDLDRLSDIVNNPKMPVQFVFAGKAHPADKAGQDLIKEIVAISKQARFLGKIVFVPGYDISLAKRMVQGVDVWMNNPTRPQEASGTSGEKAAMNGVMHFSVLDGWWVEGYREGAGWALPEEKTYDDQGYQNELDAATIYATIESEIAPLYYNRDEKTGLALDWVKSVKKTIAEVACDFTTNRMLSDYVAQYYAPQADRYERMIKDDYQLAKSLASWKSNVEREWNQIEVLSYTQPASSYNLSSKKDLNVEVQLNLANLKPEDIGVEILFATTDKKGKMHIQDRSEFSMIEYKDGIAKYHVSIMPSTTGMYQMAARIYPKHEELPHRQDFALVRWL